MSAYDLLVVGSGPAGAAAACYAAERGLAVALLTREKVPGRPVICGEFIPTIDWGYEAISSKFKWALEYTYGPVEEPGVKINEITAIEIRLGLQRQVKLEFSALVIDREKFIRRWIERAKKSGADVFTGHNLIGLSQKGNSVAARFRSSQGPVDLQAKWLIAADGTVSTSAKLVGLGEQAEVALAVNQRLRGVSYPKDRLLMWIDPGVAPRGYAWIIPRGGDEANVGLGHPVPARVSTLNLFQKMLASLPELEGSSPSSEPLGKFLPVSGLRRRVHVGRVLLAGDSAGTCIPSNGGGINTAMIAGILAVDAILGGGDGETYEKSLRRALGVLLTRALVYRRVADLLMTTTTTWRLAARILPSSLIRRGITAKSLL